MSRRSIFLMTTMSVAIASTMAIEQAAARGGGGGGGFGGGFHSSGASFHSFGAPSTMHTTPNAWYHQAPNHFVNAGRHFMRTSSAREPIHKAGNGVGPVPAPIYTNPARAPKNITAIPPAAWQPGTGAAGHVPVNTKANPPPLSALGQINPSTGASHVPINTKVNPPPLSALGQINPPGPATPPAPKPVTPPMPQPQTPGKMQGQMMGAGTALGSFGPDMIETAVPATTNCFWIQRRFIVADSEETRPVKVCQVIDPSEP